MQSEASYGLSDQHRCVALLVTHLPDTLTARVATILYLITTRKIIDISIDKVFSLLNDWSLTIYLQV